MRNDWSDPRSPGRQEEQQRELEHDREKVEAGDRRVIFYALARCAKHGLAMPDWLAEEYLRGIQKWHDFEGRTLDESFDCERQKGLRVRAERSYRQHGKAVFDEIFRLTVECGHPMSGETFELAAGNLNRGFEKTTCSGMFYRFLADNPQVLDGKPWGDYLEDQRNLLTRRVVQAVLQNPVSRKPTAGYWEAIAERLRIAPDYARRLFDSFSKSRH